MADTERTYMAPKGTPTTNTHSGNKQYRPENGNRPISNKDDLANDGTQIFHVGGGAMLPGGKATAMKPAGQNTAQSGTGGRNGVGRNYLGRRVT